MKVKSLAGPSLMCEYVPIMFTLAYSLFSLPPCWNWDLHSEHDPTVATCLAISMRLVVCGAGLSWADGGCWQGWGGARPEPALAHQRLLLAGGCDWAAAGRRREQIGCGLVPVRSPDSSHQHQHHPWSSNDCPNAILVIISKTCVGTSLLDKRSTSSGSPHHNVIRSLDKYLDLDNRHNMCT